MDSSGNLPDYPTAKLLSFLISFCRLDQDLPEIMSTLCELLSNLFYAILLPVWELEVRVELNLNVLLVLNSVKQEIMTACLGCRAVGRPLQQATCPPTVPKPIQPTKENAQTNDQF